MVSGVVERTLREQEWLAGKPALEVYFHQVAAEVAELLRPGDNFPAIELNHPFAGRQLLERLALLQQREVGDPRTQICVDHGRQRRDKAAWDALIAVREWWKRGLHYQQITSAEAEYFDITAEMLSDARLKHDQRGNPPATWRSDAETLQFAKQRLEGMSPAERAQVPLKLVTKRRDDWVDSCLEKIRDALIDHSRVINLNAREQSAEIHALQEQVAECKSMHAEADAEVMELKRRLARLEPPALTAPAECRPTEH
jgi:hypothetical protein